MEDLQFTNQAYAEQLEKKVTQTTEEFKEFGVEQMDVYESAIVNYRMRAEFRVWHEGEDLFYIMFDKGTREKYRVELFPPGSALINQLMPLVLELVKGIEGLRRKLFQIDYLSSLSGEVVMSLLYHRPLDDEWEAQVRELKRQLAERGFAVDIIGRARKMKRVMGWADAIQLLDKGNSI